MFVQWERPRWWVVRLYKPYKNRTGGYHSSIWVLALSVDRAIEAAQAQEPESRIESVNDTGAVDIVVDAPMTPNVQVEGAEGCLQPKAPSRTPG